MSESGGEGERHLGPIGTIKRLLGIRPSWETAPQRIRREQDEQNVRIKAKELVIKAGNKYIPGALGIASVVAVVTGHNPFASNPESYQKPATSQPAATNSDQTSVSTKEVLQEFQKEDRELDDFLQCRAGSDFCWRDEDPHLKDMTLIPETRGTAPLRGKVVAEKGLKVRYAPGKGLPPDSGYIAPQKEWKTNGSEVTADRLVLAVNKGGVIEEVWWVYRELPTPGASNAQRKYILAEDLEGVYIQQINPPANTP